MSAAVKPLTNQLRTESQSPRQIFVRRFRSEKTAMVGLAIIVLFVLMAVLAPVLAPFDPLEQNISDSLHAPSSVHWFGADKLGRDIFSRMLYGARISLVTGVFVVGAAATIGTLIGLVAGYVGGWWDEFLCASPTSFLPSRR